MRALMHLISIGVGCLTPYIPAQRRIQCAGHLDLAYFVNLPWTVIF